MVVILLDLRVLGFGFMDMAAITSSPRTVEEIFKDYSARRSGIVRALTFGMLYVLILTFSADFDFFSRF